jgi:hypothetical protein
VSDSIRCGIAKDRSGGGQAASLARTLPSLDLPRAPGVERVCVP